MRHEELPKECQKCINLNCSGVTMEGDNQYWCSAIPLWLKEKKTPCEKFIDGWLDE